MLDYVHFAIKNIYGVFGDCYNIEQVHYINHFEIDDQMQFFHSSDMGWVKHYWYGCVISITYSGQLFITKTEAFEN